MDITEVIPADAPHFNFYDERLDLAKLGREYKFIDYAPSEPVASVVEVLLRRIPVTIYLHENYQQGDEQVSYEVLGGKDILDAALYQGYTGSRALVRRIEETKVTIIVFRCTMGRTTALDFFQTMQRIISR